MCGITGIFSSGPLAAINSAPLVRMRDRMQHRGPDGAGLWQCPGLAFAHRRLAVVDLTPAGAQPMLWIRPPGAHKSHALPAPLHDPPDHRAPPHPPGAVQLALIYNGELYNDAELRRELSLAGVEFRSRSDTETILAAFATWGFAAIDRLRGMYALACYDLTTRRLLLARDPLGIKPLYYAAFTSTNTQHLAFASEIPALLEHPAIDRNPDPTVISSYLTTIRTTLGARTLYRGIRTIEPGARLIVQAHGDALHTHSTSHWDSTPPGQAPFAPASHGDDAIRAAVTDSVSRHLRADVPVCCLLSGGLDSSIIARLARDLSTAPMTTFCAGADGASGGSDDFTHARAMAAALGSTHIEARVSRPHFRQSWEWMSSRLCLPLSTPNEVAIHEVAKRLHEGGFTVALSGEGADELFGGYDSIMSQSTAHLAQVREAGVPWQTAGGRFHLDAAAWVSLDAKSAVLSEPMLAAADHDRELLAHYDRTFTRVATGVEDDNALEAHLRFQRAVNLPGLLLRLDQATMLESVEGRTPLADHEIARLADSLPMRRKYTGADTKIALRSAFRSQLPHQIAARPKASFPLPFQQWLPDAIDILRATPLAREWFTPAAIARVTADPTTAWQLAWPMINLAMWARRF